MKRKKIENVICIKLGVSHKLTHQFPKRFYVANDKKGGKSKPAFSSIAFGQYASSYVIGNY